MLLLLQDLILEVAEMIVIHHIVIFSSRSDQWRPHLLLVATTAHHRGCGVCVRIDLPALGGRNVVA